jgi:uncharacterized membrane protein YjdF
MAVLVLVATRNILPLSRISYTTLFVIMCLHAIGAHYTSGTLTRTWRSHRWAR